MMHKPENTNNPESTNMDNVPYPAAVDETKDIVVFIDDDEVDILTFMRSIRDMVEPEKINFPSPLSSMNAIFSDGEGGHVFSSPDINFLFFSSGVDFFNYHSKVEGATSPSIVITDIEMPRMLGTEVLSRATQDPFFSTTVFVAMSAALANSDRIWLENFGAYMFIMKPVEYRKFSEVVESTINSILLNRREIVANTADRSRVYAKAFDELARLRMRNNRLTEKYIKKLITPDVFQALEEEENLEPASREIAVGFVDIRGFTRLTNRLEVKHIGIILNSFFEMAAQIISLKGGFVDKFIGDAVMWFHQNHSPRNNSADCIDVAAGIVHSMSTLSQFVGEQLGIKIDISSGAGVAHGTCGVGIFGSPSCRIQYSAIGPAVNLASRLCAEAESREVLIGGEIVKYCKYEYENLGFHKVKGFDHEIERRRLLVPSTHPTFDFNNFSVLLPERSDG
jgi:class 3 adenylate cyclase/CheY-like chemotaxis protein